MKLPIISRLLQNVQPQRGFTLKSALLPQSDINVQPLRGFTLMELLVAIAILGILAGIGSITFSNVQEKGRDTKRKQDLQSLKIALEAYHADKGGYPPMPTDGSVKTFTSDGSSPWIEDLTTSYIKELPKDPKQDAGRLYRYDVSANRQTFVLWAQLENTNDQESYDWTNNAWRSRASCRETPTAPYNYCVQNP